MDGSRISLRHTGLYSCDGERAMAVDYLDAQEKLLSDDAYLETYDQFEMWHIIQRMPFLKGERVERREARCVGGGFLIGYLWRGRLVALIDARERVPEWRYFGSSVLADEEFV